MTPLIGIEEHLLTPDVEAAWYAIALETTDPSVGYHEGATFVLTGRAQTIQQLKAKLKELAVSSSRIMSNAYWEPGKIRL